MIRPPVYPWCAFDDRRFLSGRNLPLVPGREGRGRLTLHGGAGDLQIRLVSEYNLILREVTGVLKGEYGVLANGLMLFDRDGACVSINFPNHSAAVAHVPFEQANDKNITANREHLYADWEAIPLIQNAAVFSHCYGGNYYHFTFEFIQKFRLLGEFGVDTVLLPDELLNAPFQRDLVNRAGGARRLLSLRHPVRVRDPVIIQTYQSAEGISWLRGLYDRNSQPDGRKYYVRRTPSLSRPGNNISESEAFVRFLEAHRFIVIDFGNGENTVHDQIQMLDGASTILSAHGAGLTNITYLQGPVKIIEVFGPAVVSSSFARISVSAGFDHHALFSNELDQAGDIIVDCDRLGAILHD